MAYESATYYTNKIIKTTKAQYDALKNGESVKGYTLNAKDTFVLDIDSLYNDLANKTETYNGINKSLYNLGYYDTITENSDGTYTITRQTGYVILDGSEDGWGIYLQGLWAYIKVYNIIPVTNQNNVGQFITNRGPAVSITTMINTSSGIQIAQDELSINIRPNVSSINSLETFKQWLAQNNIAIQYKLATSYTEKVEKNHYARYNEHFVLEHNKSEAERSANLFNANNVEYGSINEDGSNLENGHARARSFYIPVLANTYYSISTNNSELLIYELYQYDSNKSHIEPYTGGILNNTFTFLTRNNTYYIRILFRNTTNTSFNLDILSRVMLNYGTTPLPYQQYEGKVVHEKDLDNYVTTDTAQSISGYKKISSIGIDTINGATLGNAIMRQNTSTGDVILGSTVRQLRLWGNGDRPTYSKDDGVSYKNLALLSDLDNYTRKTIMLPDNINLDTVDASGFYRLMNMSSNTIFSHGQMIVCRGEDTVAQMVFPYSSTKMYVRTGNPFASGVWRDWKEVAFTDHTHTSLNTAFVFKNEDMPQGSANLSATTTAHKLTLYRNGLSVPYQMDNSNDGGILRCRGNSESNVIFELATWDDSGAGETIQFNYYPTNSQATPTYSVTVPKKTGTILLTTDSNSAGNAEANKVVTRNDAGSIQTEKLAVSSGTTTKATMQYNSTEDCIEFIFA